MLFSSTLLDSTTNVGTCSYLVFLCRRWSYFPDFLLVWLSYKNQTKKEYIQDPTWKEFVCVVIVTEHLLYTQHSYQHWKCTSFLEAPFGSIHFRTFLCILILLLESSCINVCPLIYMLLLPIMLFKFCILNFICPWLNFSANSTWKVSDEAHVIEGAKR